MLPSVVAAPALSPSASCAARARARASRAPSRSPRATEWTWPMLPSVAAAPALSPSASFAASARSWVDERLRVVPERESGRCRCCRASSPPPPCPPAPPSPAARARGSRAPSRTSPRASMDVADVAERRRRPRLVPQRLLRRQRALVRRERLRVVPERAFWTLPMFAQRQRGAPACPPAPPSPPARARSRQAPSRSRPSAEWTPPMLPSVGAAPALSPSASFAASARSCVAERSVRSPRALLDDADVAQRRRLPPPCPPAPPRRQRALVGRERLRVVPERERGRRRCCPARPPPQPCPPLSGVSPARAPASQSDLRVVPERPVDGADVAARPRGPRLVPDHLLRRQSPLDASAPSGSPRRDW